MAGWRVIGGSTHICMAWGNQACVGQLGMIRIPEAWSSRTR